MDAHHILNVIGLLVEIIGAFVLAAEAIGVERIQSWAINLSKTAAEMEGLKLRRGSTFLDPNRFIAGFGSCGGVAFGYWLSSYLPSETVVKYIAILGGAMAGAFLGVFLHIGGIAILRIASTALKHLETRVRFRVIGLLGFSLLFIGFVLQLIGTVIDGFK